MVNVHEDAIPIEILCDYVGQGKCIGSLTYYVYKTHVANYYVKCDRHFKNGVDKSLVREVTREEYEAYINLILL